MKHRKGFTATNVHRLSSGEVGAVAPKRSAAKSGEEKNGASPRSHQASTSSQMLLAGWYTDPPRTDESRGELDRSRKARSGVDGLSTLRVIERLSLPSDTLVGGCPWRCSGSDLHVESREQSWRRPPVTPCGSLCARCAPVAAKLLRELLTCCFHTTPRLFRRERNSRIASPSTNTNRAHKSSLKRNPCLAASCTRKS